MKLKQKRKMKALRKLEEKKRRRKSTTWLQYDLYGVKDVSGKLIKINI
jgi:hypothetical protein